MKDSTTDRAHELWAAAQLAPGEGIEDGVARIEALLALPEPEMPEVDDLAQEIRRVDGNHSLGAGALAEALMPFFSAYGDAKAEHARRVAMEEAAKLCEAERAGFMAQASRNDGRPSDMAFGSVNSAERLAAAIRAAAPPQGEQA